HLYVVCYLCFLTTRQLATTAFFPYTTLFRSRPGGLAGFGRCVFRAAGRQQLRRGEGGAGYQQRGDRDRDDRQAKLGGAGDHQRRSEERRVGEEGRGGGGQCRG